MAHTFPPLTSAAHAQVIFNNLRLGDNMLGAKLRAAYVLNLAEVTLWPDDKGEVSYVYVTSIDPLNDTEEQILRDAAREACVAAKVECPETLRIERISCR